MKIKISEDKLEKIIDVVVNGIGVDKYDSFQSRSINLRYVEFLTPGNRRDVISRYYPDINRVVVNDEKFYDLVSVWVSSYKLYDIIKDEVIKRIYGKYTKRFKSIRYPDDIRDIKYVSNTDFNKT
jgi:uncharacterized protein YifN (PemK superfamily)